jgi:membrane protease YdiL (CAAX protease family)
MKQFSRHSFPENNHSDSDKEQQVTYVNGLGFLPETPQQTEHKQLVMQYNIVLFSILLLFFLRVIAFAPIVNFLAMLGFDIIINPLTNLVTMSSLSTQIVNMLVMICYMGIPSVIILASGKRYFRRRQIFAAPTRGTTRYGVVILLGVSVLASFSSLLFSNVMEWGGLVILREQADPPTQMPAFVLYLLSVTLVPAFLEELLFRGAILQSLRRFGDMIAVLVSTVLYALVQPSIDLAIFSFVMGLALGYFTLKSGSIVVAVTASFAIKGLSCLNAILAQYFSSAHLLRLEWIVALFLLVLSIIAFIRLVLTDPHAFELYHQDTYLTNRTKVKQFLTNLGLWMIVVLAFLYMIPYVQIIG